jgi:hypothetical protein
MAHVFISYVRENAPQVDHLCLWLKADGVQVWLDREQLRPGQRWQHGIRDAIREGTFFIACFSKEYLAKERTYMNEELSFAIDELRLRPSNRSWFIPAILNGGEVPDRSIGGGECLRDLQWVDLENDWKSGVAAILDTIRASRTNETVTSSPLSTDQRRTSALGPKYKTCTACKDSKTESWYRYSASVGIGEYGGERDCSTCRGTGQVPSSQRRGLFGLRNLLDCWNCDRNGIAYNEYHTHCPACGVDLFPLAAKIDP